jgi:3D (Asp-Asp-Asp) domain-containing protein
MCKHIKRVIGFTSSSILFLIVVNAKAPTPILPQAQEQTPNATSSSPATADISNQLAMISDPTETRVRTDIKSEAKNETAIIKPDVNPKNPSVNLKVAVREETMNARPFSTPDIGILGPPQNFRATAYALRGQTSSGVYVRRGVVAADPRVLPIGSVVEIKAGNYSGVYTVHDTGKKIKGKIIDLWVPSTYEARQFGRQDIKLHVLRYGRIKRR